jgi:hypothetical protein
MVRSAAVTVADCWSSACLCKGFVVDPYPLTSEVFKGLINPGNMGNTSCGDSVQPLQSVKLIDQPCSRSRAAWTLT